MEVAKMDFYPAMLNHFKLWTLRYTSQKIYNPAMKKVNVIQA